MSRTYRNYGYFYRKNGQRYREAQERHVEGIHPKLWWQKECDFRKIHVLHGRDGAIQSVIGCPSNDSPNYYNRYDEVWGMHLKRSAKFQTGRVRRNRDKNAIREALAEISEG